MGKERWVIRMDLQVEAEDEDAVGEMVNKMIEAAIDIIEPEHYRWKFTPSEGFDDPNLEKDLGKPFNWG